MHAGEALSVGETGLAQIGQADAESGCQQRVGFRRARRAKWSPKRGAAAAQRARTVRVSEGLVFTGRGRSHEKSGKGKVPSERLELVDIATVVGGAWRRRCEGAAASSTLAAGTRPSWSA